MESIFVHLYSSIKILLSYGEMSLIIYNNNSKAFDFYA
jgi:hypothetical protein